MMPSFSTRLSDDEIWAVSSYIRQLGYNLGNNSNTNAGLGSSTANPVLVPVNPVEPADKSENRKLVSITGLVTNGTGGTIPADMQVTLYTFDQMQIIITTTAEIESDGTYAFEAIPLLPAQNIIATVDYGGVTYSSNLSAVETNQELIELPIEFFEADNDLAGLTVDRLHYFFEVLDERTIRVVELFVISNSSPRTKVPLEKRSTGCHF